MLFKIDLALVQADKTWVPAQVMLDEFDYCGEEPHDSFDFLHVELGKLTDMALVALSARRSLPTQPFIGLCITAIEVLPDPHDAELGDDSTKWPMTEMKDHMSSLLPQVNSTAPSENLPFAEPARQDACPRCGQAFCVHNDDGACVDDQALADEYEDATALADLLQRHDAVWLARQASVHFECQAMANEADGKEGSSEPMSMAQLWADVAKQLGARGPDHILVLTYCDWCGDGAGVHECPECHGQLCGSCLASHECDELKSLLAEGGSNVGC